MSSDHDAVIAYIGLGANLGRPAESIREALRRAQAVPGVTLGLVSGLWRTEPRMVLEQPEFLNACAELRCRGLTAWGLLEALMSIERAMGRRREVDKGPRRIDLDLLLFGDAVLDEQGLQVPHPGLAERRFVLAPLVEIAPGLHHPVLGSTMAELLEGCPDEGWIERLAWGGGAGSWWRGEEP